VDFDPGGDAQRRLRQADGLVDVAGRAIAAGKEQQVHTPVVHLPGSAAGVPGRCRTGRDLADDGRLEPGGPRRVLAHLTGVGDDLQPFNLLQARQRLDGAVVGVGLGPQLPRPPLNLGPVAAFEAHPPAEAGHGVDDQAQSGHLLVPSKPEESGPAGSDSLRASDVPQTAKSSFLRQVLSEILDRAISGPALLDSLQRGLGAASNLGAWV